MLKYLLAFGVFGFIAVNNQDAIKAWALDTAHATPVSEIKLPAVEGVKARKIKKAVMDKGSLVKPVAAPAKADPAPVAKVKVRKAKDKRKAKVKAVKHDCTCHHAPVFIRF